MKRLVNGRIVYGYKLCGCGAAIKVYRTRCKSCEARRRHREGLMPAPPVHAPETVSGWAKRQQREADGRFRREG